MVKSMIDNLRLFGEKVRELRELNGLLLREVASEIEVDTAFLSKLERNEKKASRQQVDKISKALGIGDKTLITLWLSDKLLENILAKKVKHTTR